MKKILILLIILGGLVGAAVIYQKQQNATLNTAAVRGAKSRDKLLPELDILAVKKIRIQDAKSLLTVAIGEDGKSAQVVERDGYPASLDRINSMMTELYEQRISSKQEVRKGAWPEISVMPPGEGADGTGTQVELLGEGDKILKALILGKQIEVSGGRSSTQFDSGNQRFVRLPEDGDTIWVVSNTFYSLEPNAETWLEKSFFNVEKAKRVAVTMPQPEESWEVQRPSTDVNEFNLVTAKPGEKFDHPKAPLHNVLSGPVFTDVMSKKSWGDKMKEPVQVKIETFDGFTYDLQIAKVNAEGTDRYFMTVEVTAEIPKSRQAPADEKEEDKKKADEQFAAQKKSLEDKLAKEKKYSGWVYEISEYTVSNLLKKRSELVIVDAKAVPAPAEAQDAAPDAPAPTAPTAPAESASAPAPAPAAEEKAPSISVSTPAVPVPTAPTQEIKPAPEPGSVPEIDKPE